MRIHRVGEPRRVAGDLNARPGLPDGGPDGTAVEQGVVEGPGELSRQAVVDLPVWPDKGAGAGCQEAAWPSTRLGEPHAWATDLARIQEHDWAFFSEVGDDTGQVLGAQSAVAFEAELSAISGGRPGDTVAGEVNGVELPLRQGVAERNLLCLNRRDVTLRCFQL